MEGLAIVQISELKELLAEVKSIKKEELHQFQEREEKLKAYSIQQTADLLNLHYTTARTLIIKKKLYAVYLDGDKGKCSVPAWAIKTYLQKKE